jgi:hypothetical protein
MNAFSIVKVEVSFLFSISASINYSFSPSLLHLVPLLFVWLLPDSKEEQKKLRESGDSNFTAGCILATIVVLSLIGTLIVSISLIFLPGT